MSGMSNKIGDSRYPQPFTAAFETWFGMCGFSGAELARHLNAELERLGYTPMKQQTTLRGALPVSVDIVAAVTPRTVTRWKAGAIPNPEHLLALKRISCTWLSDADELVSLQGAYAMLARYGTARGMQLSEKTIEEATQKWPSLKIRPFDSLVFRLGCVVGLHRHPIRSGEAPVMFRVSTVTRIAEDIAAAAAARGQEGYELDIILPWCLRTAALEAWFSLGNTQHANLFITPSILEFMC